MGDGRDRRVGGRYVDYRPDVSRKLRGPVVMVDEDEFREAAGAFGYPAEFVVWVRDDTARLYAEGVRLFEVHNEPNLIAEGLGLSWAGGREYDAWYRDVASRLRPLFPEIKLDFPGLSPGADIPGVRADQWRFLDEAQGAVSAADWIGVHCYWADRDQMVDRAHGRGHEAYHQRWSDKLLLVTEFSNPHPALPKAEKGAQYCEYYGSLPAYVGAAFCFVLSASAPAFAGETWREESGMISPIPAIIGSC